MVFGFFNFLFDFIFNWLPDIKWLLTSNQKEYLKIKESELENKKKNEKNERTLKIVIINYKIEVKCRKHRENKIMRWNTFKTPLLYNMAFSYINVFYSVASIIFTKIKYLRNI